MNRVPMGGKANAGEGTIALARPRAGYGVSARNRGSAPRKGGGSNGSIRALRVVAGVARVIVNTVVAIRTRGVAGGLSNIPRPSPGKAHPTNGRNNCSRWHPREGEGRAKI